MKGYSEESARRDEITHGPRRRQLVDRCRFWTNNGGVPPRIALNLSARHWGCLPTIISAAAEVDRLINDDYFGELIPCIRSDLAAAQLAVLQTLLRVYLESTGGNASIDLTSTTESELRSRLQPVRFGFRRSAPTDRHGYPRHRQGAFNSISQAIDHVPDLTKLSIHPTTRDYPPLSTAICGSRPWYHFIPGDHSFLEGIAADAGQILVDSALRGEASLGGLKFKCPQCPLRPKRSLANLVSRHAVYLSSMPLNFCTQMAHISEAHGSEDVLAGLTYQQLSSGTNAPVVEAEETVQRDHRTRVMAGYRVEAAFCDICQHTIGNSTSMVVLANHVQDE